MSITRICDFDISSVSKDTVFILDTNVLYYVHSGYSLPSSTECLSYSNLIQNIMSNGYTVKVSSLSIQELLFSIENKEYQLYWRTNGINPKNYSKKDYRKDPIHRNNVKSKFKTVLMELDLYEKVDAAIELSTINCYVDTLESHCMDPIDYILVENCKNTNTIFISNDRDFQSITSIDVITA